MGWHRRRLDNETKDGTRAHSLTTKVPSWNSLFQVLPRVKGRYLACATTAESRRAPPGTPSSEGPVLQTSRWSVNSLECLYLTQPTRKWGFKNSRQLDSCCLHELNPLWIRPQSQKIKKKSGKDPSFICISNTCITAIHAPKHVQATRLIVCPDAHLSIISSCSIL